MFEVLSDDVEGRKYGSVDTKVWGPWLKAGNPTTREPLLNDTV